MEAPFHTCLDRVHRYPLRFVLPTLLLLLLLPTLLRDCPLREQDVDRVLVGCHQAPDKPGQRPAACFPGSQACRVVRRCDDAAAYSSGVSLQDGGRSDHVLVVYDIAVTGLPCDLARGREDSLPFPAPAEAPSEELGLVEHVVRDVEIKLSTFALLLTLLHAYALPLSDDAGKYKLASAGMTSRSSLAAQSA